MKTDLETELLINKIQLGWLDTAFLLPYALMQVFITRINKIQLGWLDTAFLLPYALMQVFITMIEYKKNIQIRPNKKKRVLRVTGLKILGRVGTHIFVYLCFFSGKNKILSILKGRKL